MNNNNTAIASGLLLLLMAIMIELFAIGLDIRSLKPAPVCIVVHANGAPAPASCSNPDSYQVAP